MAIKFQIKNLIKFLSRVLLISGKNKLHKKHDDQTQLVSYQH